jgi:demethylmenaquinone methyltransferase/2-methoxy-6-polyprenyl-1,4-benzoquinol methylase
MRDETAVGSRPEPRTLRRMFGRVARRYDLLNHLLSANLDRGWRRAAALELPDEPLARVLDLCGGTGDQSIAVARARPAKSVLCCDFAHPMLVRAAGKFARGGLRGRCLALEADALRLPFREGTFDAVTVAFGVRNLDDMDAGFREMRRVLRPGGRLVVLEFSQPTGAVVSRAYRFYLRHLLPRIGGRVSDDGDAYGYLARTIGSFPAPDRIAARMREAGFAGCGFRTRAGGVVAIHTAVRRSDPAEQ